LSKDQDQDSMMHTVVVRVSGRGPFWKMHTQSTAIKRSQKEQSLAEVR